MTGDDNFLEDCQNTYVHEICLAVVPSIVGFHGYLKYYLKELFMKIVCVKFD